MRKTRKNDHKSLPMEASNVTFEKSTEVNSDVNKKENDVCNLKGFSKSQEPISENGVNSNETVPTLESTGTSNVNGEKIDNGDTESVNVEIESQHVAEDVQVSETVDEQEHVGETVVIEVDDDDVTKTDDGACSVVEITEISDEQWVVGSNDGEEVEAEPLVLEAEEPEPELQFDENSDVDSRKSSPIIRCTTRRSLTRNIPTPKTPKSFLEVNEDKISECSDKQSVVTLPLSEATEAESDVLVFKPAVDAHDLSSFSKLKGDESFESVTNASTKAVVGGDTTRNFESTCLNTSGEGCSDFLTLSKGRSVGETLRCLSARKSIRSAYNPYEVDGARNKKRLSGHAYPDNAKRFKSNTPQLFSYVSSPITGFKNRFIGSEVTSSTPKLTAYRQHFEGFGSAEFGTEEMCEDPKDDKGWCALM